MQPFGVRFATLQREKMQWPVTGRNRPRITRRPTGRNGLGLFDVCPPRDDAGRRNVACGQTLNKPPGRKPRNAATRFGQAVAYGDLNADALREIADDSSIEPLATQRVTPDAKTDTDVGDGRTRTIAGGSEFWREGVGQQQAVLGTGNPEADAGV